MSLDYYDGIIEGSAHKEPTRNISSKLNDHESKSYLTNSGKIGRVTYRVDKYDYKLANL